MRGKRRVLPEDMTPSSAYTPRERLLLLDTWMRSKLPAQDFSAPVGVSAFTLYKWRQRFEEDGPLGLQDRKRGRPSGSRLSEETRRAILMMMKQQHPEWGQDRIHSMLMHTEGFGASPGAIGRFLEEEGDVVEDVPTKPHEPTVMRFERARPNQLWQTDLFTFVLKRGNRRVHLCAFMDDHSRFVVGFGLHATSSVRWCRRSSRRRPTTPAPSPGTRARSSAAGRRTRTSPNRRNQAESERRRQRVSTVFMELNGIGTGAGEFPHPHGTQLPPPQREV